MKNLARYTSLFFARRLCTAGRVILVDEPMTPGVEKELRSLETTDAQELTFLNCEELAAELDVFIGRVLAEDKKALAVFPGNGANYARKLSKFAHRLGGVSVFAKRFWEPGKDPVAVVGTIPAETFLVLDVTTVLVIDDVISSGQTMRKLHRNNAWRFPRATWVGASWASQVPQTRAASGVSGYGRVFTGCLIESPQQKRVPINSLSTLRQDAKIATQYARRHFKNPHAFLRAMYATSGLSL
jgi:hypothetical protein